VAGDPEPAVRLAWLEALDGGSAASRAEALRALLGRDGDAAVRARAVELLQSAGALRDPEAALELYRSWKGDAMADARGAALVAALMIVFPVSKLLHAPGVFFSPSLNQADDARERRHVAGWSARLS